MLLSKNRNYHPSYDNNFLFTYTIKNPIFRTQFLITTLQFREISTASFRNINKTQFHNIKITTGAINNYDITSYRFPRVNYNIIDNVKTQQSEKNPYIRNQNGITFAILL